jgi:peptide/nickel transport system substrate-binding protein
MAMRLPQTLNPLLNTDPTVDMVLQLLFEPIAVIDETLFPAPNPAIINSIEFSTDGLVVFITISNNARWSDGQALTANDVIFTVNYLRDLPYDTDSLYKTNIENIIGVTAVNPQTVRMVLSAPTGGAAYFLCFPVIPEHYYNYHGRYNPEGTRNNAPVGSGAFRLSYRHFAIYLMLARNGHAANPAYLDNIKVYFTPDGETDLHAFTQNVTQTYFAPFYDRRRLQGIPHTSAREFPSRSYEFMGFNHSMQLFQDIGVRRAVSLAAPRDLIQRDAYFGSLFPAAAFVTARSWLFDASTNIQPQSADLTSAKETLLKSSYPPTMYLLEITILVNSENAERRAAAALLRDNLNQIGFIAAVDEVPFNEYLRRIEIGDYHLYIGGYNFGLNSDFGNAFGDGGGLYRISSELGAILSAVNSALTQTDYAAAMSDFQTYILTELPFAGFGYRSSALITRSRVHGTSPPSPTHIYNGISNWYVTQ